MASIPEIITTVGIPTIAGGLMYVGKKLQILSDMQRTVGKIKSNVQVISNALIASDIEFDDGRLQACSPLQLTEKGDQFLKEIGFKKLFAEHSEDFFRCINEEDPQTDYDIENISIKCVFLLFGKPYFKEVKDYLYNHPNEDKREVMKIAGIYVRNKYMEETQSS